MNYPTFLKEVDQAASKLSAEKLRQFVHELASSLPETDREHFLSVMKSYNRAGGKVQPGDGKGKKKEDTNFEEYVEKLIDKLGKITDGDYALEGSLNERYDEWWNDEEDEYIFSDPDDILIDIKQSVETLHVCLDREEYVLGAKLAQALSELEIKVYGEYSDYCGDNIDLDSLITTNNLLNVSMKQTTMEALYLAYMGNAEEDRAEAMTNILDHMGYHAITLADILKMGKTEIDAGSFLYEWIDELAARSEIQTDKLLLEALNMLPDKNAKLEIAGKYAKSHPTLYKEILENGLETSDPKEMMEHGLRALKAIPDSSSQKCEVSLLTAKYALQSQDIQTAEDCWIEAFRTEPTTENYLRVRIQAQNWTKYEAFMRYIYTEHYASESRLERGPQAAMMFFDGRFDEMLDTFMDAGSGIGWSYTFMKGGIALILMTLNAGRMDLPGMKIICNKAMEACRFDAESYCEGTDLSPDVSSISLFLECFAKWKGETEIPEDICTKWISKLEKWIPLRVSAIMSANKRDYYFECAAFIAAYGEVLESRGQKGAKKLLALEYKSQYPRRRAFIAEMEKVGLKI